MRFALSIAPLLSLVSAYTSTFTVVSGGTTQTSTFTYENGFTSFLTQTDSRGVVTGIPTQPTNPAVVTSQPTNPAAVTTQPTLATIPAGLPPGYHTLIQNISRTLTSFSISVGSSTTVVLVPAPATTSAPTTSGSGGSGASGQSGQSSPSSTSATGAGMTLQLASGGFFGVGALLLALV